MFAEKATGRLRDAIMAAPGADHTGQLMAWANESHQTAEQTLDRPIYHPTLEEALKPALRDICRQTDCVQSTAN
jgi:dihydrolipoamide dehydrogenase